MRSAGLGAHHPGTSHRWKTSGGVFDPRASAGELMKPVATVEPVRFQPGKGVADVRDTVETSKSDSGHIVRGQALIFWDPKNPNKMLDAIDTDQITPSKDCVSESLDALDRHWKEGAFRYLMPDFRARVHK